LNVTNGSPIFSLTEEGSADSALFKHVGPTRKRWFFGGGGIIRVRDRQAPRHSEFFEYFFFAFFCFAFVEAEPVGLADPGTAADRVFDRSPADSLTVRSAKGARIIDVGFVAEHDDRCFFPAVARAPL
jgi:hypothetical protein